MTNITLVLVLILFAGSLAFMSCNDSLVGDDDFATQEITVNKTIMPAFMAMNSSFESINYCGESAVYTLFAGQTINAGTVTVANDEDYLYVTYATYGDVLINEVHLFVGAQEFLKRLAPGQAPYVAENVNAQEYTFSILLSDLGFECGSTLYLQAHAALSNGETAYGGTITKPKKGSWYGSLAYTVQCCVVEPPVDCVWNGETAWGGATEGMGAAWWLYFNTEVNATQPIFAGQAEVEGAYVSYDAINDIITITLGENMRLTNDDESVKVEGYQIIPIVRPAAGQFKLYKGTELVIQGNGSAYYAIHLDVEVKECYAEGIY